LEACIVTLRKDLQKKACITTPKFWMRLLAVKGQIMTSPNLDTNRHKRDQASKQQIKKHNQEAMQRQSKETRSFTRKVIETLLNPEDSDFIINVNQKQEGIKKKKGSKE
jgi:hypothetical protein